MKFFLKRLIYFFYYVVNAINFSLLSAKLGKKCKINGIISLKKTNSKKKNLVKIGNNVSINSSRTSNPICGEFRTLFYTIGNGTIDISDFAGLSNVTIVARKHVSIGSWTIIGSGTKIYDNDFHSIYSKDRCNGNKNIKCKEIIIGERCFIGAGCFILKGVTIGNDSVIAAGSVVTKCIPEKEVWGGNPARFIKKLDS